MSKRKKIEIGMRFGKLIVISKAESILGGDTIKRLWGAWNCLCDCGNIKIVKTTHLNKGAVTSCGCLYNECGRALKPGQKFGRLITVSYKDGRWLCICECNTKIDVLTHNLTNGNTKSCGCLKTDELISRIYKLSDAKREFEPRIASARRVYKNTYSYRDNDCVDFETFIKLSQQNCFYCGIKPNTRFNYFSNPSSRGSEKAKNEGLFIYNGLDRIDSNQAHTLENIVTCCYDCNRAKNDRTIDEFLLWASQLKIITFKPIEITLTKFPNKPLSSSIKSIFYGYKNDTNLTVEEFYSMCQMNCYYCGSAPNNFFDRGKSDKKASKDTKINGSFYYNGLDRIDRNFPHNKDNIVPCCYYCNFAKGKLSFKEFQDWIRRIKDYQL